MSGKVACIAGGTGDIGRAIVSRFLKDPSYCAVYAIGREPRKLTSEEQSADGRLISLPVNLANASAIKHLCRRLKHEHGRLDTLVNSQGEVPPLRLLAELRTRELDMTFALHLRSPMLLTCNALPLLRATSGTVINIASISGLHANAYCGIYGAAKAALIHFSRILAQEEGSRVRINVVCPGWVESATMQRVLEQFQLSADTALANTPFKRAAQPQEVAETVHWLSSPHASYVSGGVLTVDGGGQP